MTEVTANHRRSAGPDQLRGFAVVLMIIFHFSYDLALFSFVQIDFQENLLWWLFPRFIVFLFLFSMGLSFYLAHYPQVHWKKFFQRLGIISGCALVISLVTYVLFPDRWIYFGTLHCIALCSLTAPILMRGRFTGLAVFVALFLPLLFGMRYWWWTLPHRSMDYIPYLPWVGIVGLGLFAAHFGMARKRLPLPEKISQPLEFLGRHSLIVYLLHQPLLFGICYLLHKAIGHH